MKPTITIFGECTYCGAHVARRVPPSKKIPELLYCNKECRSKSMAREAGKVPRVYETKYPLLHDQEYLSNALRDKTPREVAEDIGCGYDAVRKAAHRYEIVWARKVRK